MLTWPFKNNTPGALSTASSTVLTARRARSLSLTSATLVADWSSSCDRFAAVTMTASSANRLDRSVTSRRTESPAGTATVSCATR